MMKIANLTKKIRTIIPMMKNKKMKMNSKEIKTTGGLNQMKMMKLRSRMVSKE